MWLLRIGNEFRAKFKFRRAPQIRERLVIQREIRRSALVSEFSNSSVGGLEECDSI